MTVVAVVKYFLILQLQLPLLNVDAHCLKLKKLQLSNRDIVVIKVIFLQIVQYPNQAAISCSMNEISQSKINSLVLISL